jgi:hypothetical protein
MEKRLEIKLLRDFRGDEVTEAERRLLFLPAYKSGITTYLSLLMRRAGGSIKITWSP